MKFKKKLALVMATVATLTSIGATTVFANESNDTEWELYPWSWENSKFTEDRNKTDTTSGWGNILKGNAPNQHATMQLRKAYNGGDLIGKYRVLPPVDFYGNVGHYVPSNAYENGYRYVCMMIVEYTQPGSSNFGCSGLWSPDSY